MLPFLILTVFQLFQATNVVTALILWSMTSILGLGFFFFPEFLANITKTQSVLPLFHFLFYLMSITLFYLGVDNHFENAEEGTFYLGYMIALYEGMIAKKIPEFFLRAVFCFISSIICLILVPINKSGTLVAYFVMVLSVLYLENDQIKNNQDTTKINSNPQNFFQMQSLVINQIPESISIVTPDLSKCLFVNNAFQASFGDRSYFNIQNFLDKFIVQENVQNLEDKEDKNFTQSQSLPRKIEAWANMNIGESEIKFSCKFLSSEVLLIDNQHNNQKKQTLLFDVSVSNVTLEDRPALILTFHDITHYFSHEKVSKDVSEKTQDSIPLSIISQELLIPLNSIIWSTNLMKKHIHDQEVLSYLDICSSNSHLLLNLLNSILDLSLIRTKKFKLSIESFNLHELMKETLKIFQLQCTQKNVLLKMKISSKVPRMLKSDKGRLKQIFINLISNAIKYTTKGSIYLSAEISSNTSKHIEISVKDTGIGIPEEKKEKILYALQKDYEGSLGTEIGMGLTISDYFARLLHGEKIQNGLKIQSQSGEGSTFSFLIKCDLTECEQEKEASLQKFFTFEDLDEEGQVPNRMMNYRPSPLKKALMQGPQNKSPSFSPIIARIKGLENLSNPSSPKGGSSTPGSVLFRARPILPSGFAGPADGAPYVLVVDDNPFNILVTEYSITSLRYKVKTALFGQEAIDLITENDHALEPIKLILMELNMPVMDGYETARILKKMMSEKVIPEIPIVALSTNDMEESIETALKAGMSEYLSLPIKEPELVRVLEKYCKWESPEPTTRKSSTKKSKFRDYIVE